MAKSYRKRVKTLAASRAKSCFGPVKGVADNRMASHCELGAYLVRHTRENRHLQKSA